MNKAEYDAVEPEDFIVRIRPSTNSSGSWNGEIDVAIITQPDNPLDDEDYFQICRGYRSRSGAFGMR